MVVFHGVFDLFQGEIPQHYQPMHFAELQRRLIAALQGRLRNGQLTERRLARLTGISQPHIHNVLKGKRILSLRASDIILRKTELSIPDLLRPEASAGRFCTGCGVGGRFVEVPVLAGWLGPGLPLPREPSSVDRYPFPGAHLASVERPLVARLAADPKMRTRFRESDLALLDHSPARRAQLRQDALYLVNRRGEGLIRHVFQERDDLLVLRGADGDKTGHCEALPLGWLHLLDVVQARVAWIGRFLDPR